MQLIHGDCLVEMKNIANGSIDMVLSDLPFGTTACKWDVVIPFEHLWEHYWRVLKPNGVVVLFGSQPFTTKLVFSQMEYFKYEWVWEKSNGTNFMSVKHQPFKVHENILVFSKYAASFTKKGSMPYNPQMGNGASYKQIAGKKQHQFHGGGKGKIEGYESINHGKRYPRSVVKINEERGLHPTQKPVALLEYLINTYTVEGETVLDNCMGSGSTGVACINTKRDFVGIEKDENYFNIGKERIVRSQNEPL